MLRRRRSERGSVTVFTAVFAIAVVFLLALILDGGSALNAKERAMDIAGQAARAAADTIDLQALRKVTSTTMVSCTAPQGSDRATVLVSVSTRPLVPGILTAFHESAQASATPECGINQGAPC